MSAAILFFVNVSLVHWLGSKLNLMQMLNIFVKKLGNYFVTRSLVALRVLTSSWVRPSRRKLGNNFSVHKKSILLLELHTVQLCVVHMGIKNTSV